MRVPFLKPGAFLVQGVTTFPTVRALRRLGLDRIWWLVTPGNPLKDTRGLAPLKARIAAARALARHPRIDVSGIEAAIGARYTYETVRYLTKRCSGVNFVWIMGADNLRSFHRWQNWHRIAALIPIAVVDRLGPELAGFDGALFDPLAPGASGLEERVNAGVPFIGWA